MKNKLLKISVLICTCAAVMGISALAAPSALGDAVVNRTCMIYSDSDRTVSAGKVKKGVSVTVTDMDKGVFRITANGKKGWICGKDLSLKNSSSPVTNISAKKDSPVYAKANDKSKEIATVFRGAEKKVLGYSGNYHKVKVKDKYGWVRIDKGDFRINMTDKPEKCSLELFKNFAESKAGSQYAYGAAGPDAFDSSGLIYFCMKRFGTDVPRTIEEQYDRAGKISGKHLNVGHVVFFDKDLDGKADYGAVCIGKHKAVCAANPKTGVKIIDLKSAYYKAHLLACGSFWE